MIGTLYLYKQTHDSVEQKAFARASLLENYFLSMRYVYHHQFLQSGFELDEKTVGFLPAHASTRISNDFAQKMGDGTTIRNVSDDARNPDNKADRFEEQSIRYFLQNPKQKAKLETIEQNGQELFFYSAPIRVQGYCVSCHGTQEEVLPFVLKKYDTAYGYKEGDIRGVTSIKIPLEKIYTATMTPFYKNVALNWFIMFLLLIGVYYIVKLFTLKEAQKKRDLEIEVNKKTSSLQLATQKLLEANEQQKHLFSILRTVADCNQVLITAQTLDELLLNAAKVLQENETFDGVKVIVRQEGVFKVKVSLGLDEEYGIYPIEQEVLENGVKRVITSHTQNIPQECVDRIKRHNIKEVYCLPLKKDFSTSQVLGELTICSSKDTGVDDSEQKMLQELTGDIGFAINSFLQKETIQKLSYYDTLTNLPNKKMLVAHLSKLLQKKETQGSFNSLLYINIDNFKTINDLFGITMGDSILQSISQKFEEILEEGEYLFHKGGDEFVILCERHSQNMEKAISYSQKRAQALLDAVKDSFVLESQSVYITLSVGVMLFKDKSMNTYELLNAAESAMRMAKMAGKNSIRFYDHESQELAITRSSMMQDLQDAILKDEFFLVYQKQVDTIENIVGVEALIRWRHPSKGIISPMIFIPLVEEAGLIVSLGEWILKEAIAQLKIWSTQTQKQEWRISINISSIQFTHESFVKRVKEFVLDAKVDPSKIRLELTESILISDVATVTQKIKELKEFGFSISIDDFGTGYSSLSYLKNLELDELKIDQSFVKNISINSADRTIVQTIIAMGEAFDLEVIAEGVETKEQYEILKQMGCTNYQGYLFAKPQNSQDL
jgi:diguanylate cyclase